MFKKVLLLLVVATVALAGRPSRRMRPQRKLVAHGKHQEARRGYSYTYNHHHHHHHDDDDEDDEGGVTQYNPPVTQPPNTFPTYHYDHHHDGTPRPTTPGFDRSYDHYDHYHYDQATPPPPPTNFDTSYPPPPFSTNHYHTYDTYQPPSTSNYDLDGNYAYYGDSSVGGAWSYAVGYTTGGIDDSYGDSYYGYSYNGYGDGIGNYNTGTGAVTGYDGYGEDDEDDDSTTGGNFSFVGTTDSYGADSYGDDGVYGDGSYGEDGYYGTGGYDDGAYSDGYGYGDSGVSYGGDGYGGSFGYGSGYGGTSGCFCCVDRKSALRGLKKGSPEWKIHKSQMLHEHQAAIKAQRKEEA